MLSESTCGRVWRTACEIALGPELAATPLATASNVMCWVAASRGADLARQRGDERAKQWQAGADEIRAEVLEKGVSDRGVLRQHYETGDLDASLLLLLALIEAVSLLIAAELAEDVKSAGWDPAAGTQVRSG